MITDQDVISIIREYSDHYIVPSYSFHNTVKSEIFKQISFMQWATDELIRYILDHPGDPYGAVETFSFKMYEYSKRKPFKKDLFRSAMNLSENILDILNAASYAI